MSENKVTIGWFLLRISLGWIFLWAFLDKTFGLGFHTCNAEGKITLMCENAWINGGSPAMGFLKYGAVGPLKGIFNALAGSMIVDWLFMIGLLGIGVALIFGVARNITTYAGFTLMILMWLAVLPKENNPFMDDHIIYAIALLLYDWENVSNHISLSKWWNSLGFVQKNKYLQ